MVYNSKIYVLECLCADYKETNTKKKEKKINEETVIRIKVENQKKTHQKDLNKP